MGRRGKEGGRGIRREGEERGGQEGYRGNGNKTIWAEERKREKGGRYNEDVRKTRDKG